MAALGECRILLVEDDALIAMVAEDVLREAGAAVDTATSAEHALELLAGGELPHAAVLDVNLGSGRTSEPVVAVLREHGVGFVVTSGYATSGLPSAYLGAPLLSKPYRGEALVGVVAGLCFPDRQPRQPA